MKKLFFIFFGIIIFVICLGVIVQSHKKVEVRTDNLRIAASFYPLADFAEHVAGDLAIVQNITGNGVEPHDFDPSPQNIIDVESSDLFIYNGSGLDTWADRIAEEASQKGARVINMSSFFNLRPAGHNEASREQEGNIAYDPHIWLNPVNAIREVEEIRDALISIDSVHTKEYMDNAAEYIGQLSALNQEFVAGLFNCAQNRIIVSHDAFEYLAQEYGFETLSISGISPDEETSSKAMADLVSVAKSSNIKYIFFESLVSPKLSETIAYEAGAETLVLNPVAGLTRDEIVAGDDYISLMKKNLSNLQLAMRCQNQ